MGCATFLVPVNAILGAVDLVVLSVDRRDVFVVVVGGDLLTNCGLLDC